MAVVRRHAGQAKRATRSQPAPVAVIVVIAPICLSLAGCDSKVTDEDGTPWAAQFFFSLIVCCFALAVLISVCFAEKLLEDPRDCAGELVSLACLLGSAYVSLYPFFILMGPRWHLSIRCDQSAASTSCNGRGSMECNRDFLYAANHPKCSCHLGWEGPTCDMPITTVTTSTRTTSTTTQTGTTTTRTTATATVTATTTTTQVCLDGSTPKLGVEILLDPSTQCAGVSVGVPAVAGAFVGVLVVTIPMIMVLFLKHRHGVRLELIFDVITASLDFGSDLFWILTAVFYGMETLVPAVVFLVIPSFAFTVWFFGPAICLRPQYWAPQFFTVLATGFDQTVLVLTSLSTRWWQHCDRFSEHCGCFQFRQEIDGNTEICCVNIIYWLVTVLVAILGALAIFGIAVGATIAGILLGMLLLAVWLTATALWCLGNTLVVMALHVTRLAALRLINGPLLRNMDPACRVGPDPETDQVTDTASGEHPVAQGPDSETDEVIDPLLWHAMFLSEALLESVPCFLVNIVDMILLDHVGMQGISFQAFLAAASSFVAIFRILFRYCYFLIYKGIRLEDIKIKYSTRNDVAASAGSATATMAGPRAAATVIGSP